MRPQARGKAGPREKHHGIARQHAVGAGLPEALFNGREEVLRYAAAEDLLGEDHVFLLILGLKDNMDIAELAAAACPRPPLFCWSPSAS